MKSTQILVSVVIPTYNEQGDIAECLKSLLEQSYKPLEIIIVDDGSRDKTREIIRSFKSVKLIEGQHKGPGFSRNLGAKQAKGDILVFVDADMTFDEDYIKTLTLPIREGKSIGTEERKQIASNTNNIWSKCWGAYAKETLPNRGQIFRAIKKDIFLERGGFDPRYGYADDMTLFFKYGMKSDIVDGAVCYHKNPETLRAVYKQSKWIGSSLPSQWKLLSIPIISHLISIFIYPASVLAIPLITMYKTIKRKQPGMIGYFFVFYSVRYFGTAKGIFNKLFRNINTR